jgi:hypothetical protein
MPMLVDATPFGDRANWTLTISGVLALGALYLLARGMMHVTNPAGHAALVRLEKGGTPIAEASRRIAADLTAGNVVKIKGHSLTSGFLAKPGLLSFDVKPFDRLIWAYPQVTNKKIYGFIPAGSTQQALLGFADASVELQLRKDQTDPLFHHLSTHAPWALYGHSPEIAQAYAGQRAALIQHVEERKAQWAAHVAAQNAGAEHGAGGAEATGGDPKQPPA